MAQRVSPVSLKAVVGTKADLQDSREVSTQEALVSCRGEAGGQVCRGGGRGAVVSYGDLPIVTVVLHCQEFCSKHSGNTKPIPYYETSTMISDTIALAFQEIMARPLINDYVVSSVGEVGAPPPPPLLP